MEGAGFRRTGGWDIFDSRYQYKLRSRLPINIKLAMKMLIRLRCDVIGSCSLQLHVQHRQVCIFMYQYLTLAHRLRVIQMKKQMGTLHVHLGRKIVMKKMTNMRARAKVI